MQGTEETIDDGRWRIEGVVLDPLNLPTLNLPTLNLSPLPDTRHTEHRTLPHRLPHPSTGIGAYSFSRMGYSEKYSTPGSFCGNTYVDQ